MVPQSTIDWAITAGTRRNIGARAAASAQEAPQCRIQAKSAPTAAMPASHWMVRSGRSSRVMTTARAKFISPFFGNSFTWPARVS